MKRYLVGGAVRDALLGLPAGERDWVLVGADPETLLAQGFRPVGSDFPVFLDPEHHEEHALARTERKTGRGYHGFTFHADPSVTLEEDLRRRDLTINAMARDDAGEVIDPYGGRRDLEAHWLRHVSPAFAEDPVRILRVARFAARFEPLGFRIADETWALMRQMVAAGEADALVAERVWQETARALLERRPSVFFTTLRDCGALARVMPELDALFGVPQPEAHHPEIDTGLHVLMCLDAAAACAAALEVRVAVLLHDLGKALTPRAEWPRHPGHDARGVALVRRFCERLRVPNAARELALLVTAEHVHVHQAIDFSAEATLRLLERLDAFRRPERFALVLQACQCDARGRRGREVTPYPSAPRLRAALEAARAVQLPAEASEWTGAQRGEGLRQARLLALRRWREDSAHEQQQSGR